MCRARSAGPSRRRGTGPTPPCLTPARPRMVAARSSLAHQDLRDLGRFEVKPRAPWTLKRTLPSGGGPDSTSILKLALSPLAALIQPFPSTSQPRARPRAAPRPTSWSPRRPARPCPGSHCRRCPRTRGSCHRRRWRPCSRSGPRRSSPSSLARGAVRARDRRSAPSRPDIVFAEPSGRSRSRSAARPTLLVALAGDRSSVAGAGGATSSLRIVPIALVVDDRDVARRAGEVDEEGLVGLDRGVAHDRHRDRLGELALGEGQRAAGGGVVGGRRWRCRRRSRS